MKNFMKKALVFSLMLTIALGTFVACGSDDDDNGGSVAARVAGTYTGRLVAMEFNDNIDVVVAAVSDDEVLITFGEAAGIAPYKKKLIDTGVQGVIHSTVDPLCSFSTLEGGLIINFIAEIRTFTGKKK